MISCCRAKWHYCYGVKVGNTYQNKNCIYPLTQKSQFWKFSLTLLVSLCSSHKKLWNLSGSQSKHIIIACMRAAGQLLLCLETAHSWTSAKVSPAIRIMFFMQEQKLKGLSETWQTASLCLKLAQAYFCPQSIGQRSHMTKSELIQAVEYSPPMGKAVKDWRQKEKGMAEDEMVRNHHWVSAREFDQTPGDSEGQGSLVCWSP